jgi:hypothetical protein
MSVLANVIGRLAERARGFKFAEDDPAILDSDGELIAFVDVEESPSFGRHDDPSEIIDLSDDEGVQGVRSIRWCVLIP